MIHANQLTRSIVSWIMSYATRINTEIYKLMHSVFLLFSFSSTWFIGTQASTTHSRKLRKRRMVSRCWVSSSRSVSFLSYFVWYALEVDANLFKPLLLYSDYLPSLSKLSLTPFFSMDALLCGCTHTLMLKLLYKLQALEAESVTVATLTASVDRRLRKRFYGEGREPLFHSSKLQRNSFFHASTDIVNLIARPPDGI